MTFNRMGTVPLPLALHLASYTVLGLFGILMARKEVVILGFLASAAWLIAAAVGAARFGFDWRLTVLLAALGASGLVVLGLYRTRILEHCAAGSPDVPRL